MLWLAGALGPIGSASSESWRPCSFRWRSSAEAVISRASARAGRVIVAQATASVARLDPIERRLLMRHPTVFRSVLRALQLSRSCRRAHDRGFGAGIEDLPAQRRLALAVVHDRHILRERLDQTRDV